jgi:hypothetical protein
MRHIRAACGPDAHLAAVPGTYRTTLQYPYFFNLKNPDTGLCVQT